LRNDDNELTPLDNATENFLNQIHKDGRIFKILVDLDEKKHSDLLANYLAVSKNTCI